MIVYIKRIWRSFLEFVSPQLFEKYSAYRERCYAKSKRKQANSLLKKRLQIIKTKKEVNVAFFANNIGMWRYQPLVDVLLADDRFNVSVLITPFVTYSSDENRKNAKIILDYFKTKKIVVYDGTKPSFSESDWWKVVKPDLIFACQPYSGQYNNSFEWELHPEILFAYYPYGVPIFNFEWTYNLLFHNKAWRFYCPDKFSYSIAKHHMDNGGSNLKLCGDLRMSEFNNRCKKNVWNYNDSRKRIIFAPHFTVSCNEFLHRAGFLAVADTMIELVKKYKDKTVFAFKPHPRLKSELYKHKDWGVRKTDRYYRFWEEGENTMLFDGEYVDLFLDSDAMIHNSCSFTAEYLRTGNPVFFITGDLSHDKKDLNEFGEVCMDLHYYGISCEEIESFLFNTVINGCDPKIDERVIFKDNVLNKTYGALPEHIIYDDLRSSLFEDNLDN